MKPAITFLLCLVQLATMAQQPLPASEKLMKDGIAYLNGITKTYNPARAKDLFVQSATLGNAKAMNTLGNLFVKGTLGRVEIDSALYWYNAAIASGYPKANFNIGQLYKTGTGMAQNFTTAVQYFAKGSIAGDADCTNSLAYMYYKGLGIQQDYYKSFTLYKQIAEKGNANAMYFLGLCYRNGYGTVVNKVEAKKWLQKAVALHDSQAIQELNGEPLPENMSTISPTLQNKLETLKKYTEKYEAAVDNNYQGEYNGYVVYYDWSGKYVSEILPLQLTLQKTSTGYEGTWIEGTDNKASIQLNVLGSRFEFGGGSIYNRVNHYSGHQTEEWQFNNARLQLGFIGDSIQLTGYVQFYSPKRMEPGKPIQIFVTKATGMNATQLATLSKVTLYPNPAQQQTTVQFTLTQPAKVAIQVITQTGTTVYRETEKKLPAGTYNYAIPLGNLPAMPYQVNILVNGKAAATKPLIKQ